MEGILNDTSIEIKDAPHSLKLEQEILGSVILDDKLMRNLFDVVTPQMFHEKAHKDIYTAMLYLYHNNVGIGYETLVHRLQAKGKDDMVEYIFDLKSIVITDEDFNNKVELFIDIYRKRALYEEAMYLVTSDINGIASANLVKKIEKKIDGMGINSNIEYQKFEDYIDEWLEWQEDPTIAQTHKLGFKELDKLVLLEEGSFTLIGARPSVGKSALATAFVKNSCLQGTHPLFISLEMSRKKFMNRLVANMAKVEARKLNRKEHKTQEEWQRIMKAKEEIRKFKFNFYDKGGMKIEQLMGFARYLKKQGELDIIFIDYLQLLRTTQYRGQKQNQVSYISESLKQLAMELQIPIVALSQLNRGVITDGKPREPHLSDLRDSGSLEQDADIVIMLHTDDIEQRFQQERFIKLFVRKNRDGKLGQINYTYYGDYVQFVEKSYNIDTKSWEIVEQEDLTNPNNIVIDEDDLPF